MYETDLSKSHLKQEIVKLGGMQCSFCVESITKAFKRMNGVHFISVSLSHEEALLEYDEDFISLNEIYKTFHDLGFSIRDPEKHDTIEADLQELRKLKVKAFIGAGIIFLSLVFMGLMWLGYQNSLFPWVMLFLALFTMFGVGRNFLLMAISSLKRGILNQHVLMEFGAFGGLIGGILGFFIQPWPTNDFFGAAIFITIYHVLSAYVSALVRARSSHAIYKLMDLQPSTARVKHDDNTVTITPINEIRVHDKILVKPGDSIPVDGIIREGVTTVDMSLVTGEVLPVVKKPGDLVVGGSTNVNGAIIIEVVRPVNEGFLYQVAQAIREAQALKPNVLQLVERVLKHFVPAVLVAAMVSFVGWTLGAWLISGTSHFERALFASLAVLVMGYPCAIGMATPLALIRGSGLAAEHGVLMRAGEAFQAFKDIDTICFDKTGTLTEGKPVVSNLMVVDAVHKDMVIRLAASIENLSEHPLGKAIVNYAHKNNISYDDVRVQEFEAFPGLGVQARIGNEVIYIGNARFFEGKGITVTLFHEVSKRNNNVETLVGIGKEDSLLAVFSLIDQVKPDAKTTINKLKEAGITPILITGDNAKVATQIGSQLGITQVYSGLVPHEKAEFIHELQQRGSTVAMVGDGINDAPALIQADVGLAFSSGSDIAIESADIILVNNHVTSVLIAYQIAKQSYKKTVQNVSLAFSFNGLGVPLAMTGILHPVFAMIAMATSVSTVLLNSYMNFPKSQTQDTTKQVLLEITIPTIHCQGCITNLKDSLESLPNVLEIHGDLETKTLRVVIMNQNGVYSQIMNAIHAKKHSIREIKQKSLMYSLQT